MGTGVKKFQDMIVWQRSLMLCKRIYTMTNGMRDFSFKDQIRRASMSVGANISEGFHRTSPKEFKYFLSIARGSVNEVHNFVLLGRELEYFDKTEDLELECARISRMILNLMKTL